MWKMWEGGLTRGGILRGMRRAVPPVNQAVLRMPGGFVRALLAVGMLADSTPDGRFIAHEKFQSIGEGRSTWIDFIWAFFESITLGCVGGFE